MARDPHRGGVEIIGEDARGSKHANDDFLSECSARDSEYSRNVPRLAKRIGPYRVEEILGSGGTSEVYSARHEGGGPLVALKVLRRNLPSKERSQFVEEARLSVPLESPHLVKIIDSSLERGRPWIAMELAPGKNLADAMRSERSRVRQQVPRIFCGLLKALKTLHDAGLVHHDVTPSNLLLDEKGNVVLVDLGMIGKPGGGGVGTLAYLPPEVLKGGAYWPSADMYQAGALLYEVLSGYVPHEDLGGGYLDRRKAGDPPALLSEVTSGASRSIVDLLAELLAPDPSVRPSADEALGRSEKIGAPWFHGPPTPEDFGAGLKAEPSIPGRGPRRQRLTPRSLVEPVSAKEVGSFQMSWILGACLGGSLLAWLLGLI